MYFNMSDANGNSYMYSQAMSSEKTLHLCMYNSCAIYATIVEIGSNNVNL